MPDAICTARDESGQKDPENPLFQDLWADCKGNPPLITCPFQCCTECFVGKGN